jgi:AraC family transcriptional regulator
MILHAFPDLHWLKKQAEESFTSRRDWKGDVLQHKGWPNVILNVNTTNICRDNIRGPFSIFMNVKGESSVEIDGRRNSIRQEFFFISNHDQYYTLEVDRKQETETFNIHFGEYFVDQVWQSLVLREDQLLDNHFQVPMQAMAFHNRLVLKSNAMMSTIKSVRQKDLSTSVHFEQKLEELIRIVLDEELELRKLTQRIPTIKSSTKKEILKRLTLSTDFIYSNYTRNVSLEEIAAASCLSKFHFLRLFKTAFNKTPGEFIDELRIKKALELIRNSKLGIAQIAANIGYTNSSSFSRMFKNRVGRYPSEIRVS